MRKRPTVLQYILLVALVLRLVGINQSFWLDEATSGLVVRNFGLSEIVTKFLPGDFHPPLYYFVLKGWAEVFGTSEIGLRLLSVGFGVGAVWLTYLIGKSLKSELLGQISALLVATAPLHVYYSQEARMYAMGVFMVLLTVYFFVQENWVGLASALALLFLTDYLLVLIVPVLWSAAWLKKRGKKKVRKWWRQFGTAHLGLVAVVVVWWPVFRKQLEGGLGVATAAPGWWGALGGLSAKNAALIPVKMMIGRVGFEDKNLYGLVMMMVGGVFGYILCRAWKERKKYGLIWLWLLVPVALGTLISLWVPVLTYFRFIFVLPAFYILVAVGLLRFKDRFLPVVGVVLLINFAMIAVYHRNPRNWREDWRGLVGYVESERADKNARVIFVNAQMEGYRYYAAEAELWGPEGVEEGLDEIWLMRYVWDVFDPNDNVRKKVEELGYEKMEERDFGGVVIWRYENRS